MADMVLQRQNEYNWVRYIRQRITQNKNFLAIISGQTGSGKSWTALAIAEMIDPDFNIERIVFKGKELMDLINSNKLTKKGSVIVWDEAGVDLSNRSWQSLTNRMLNYLLQTFRNKCFILLFTVPYMDFIDSNSRKLFHAEIRTISIDYKKETVKIKPQLIQYNPRMQKFYYKYLRVITKTGTFPVMQWDVPKPSSELVNQYEIKKNAFTKELNINIGMALNKLEVKENKDTRKPLTPLQDKILELWKKGITQHKEIANRLGKARPQITMNIGYMKRKGYRMGI